MPNLLQYETSPYLLQHANNPVQWQPWGDAAIAQAKALNKPILVSIGYAACHWCHVMEHESFENEATANLMNQWFVNIKIDREERPDIDAIYMDAVQAMAGQGGWPLNVFLTPDLKPFYGGTYFPATEAYNRSTWQQVLQGVHTAWEQRSNELVAQAEELMAHLNKSNSFGSNAVLESIVTKDNLMAMANNILKNADTKQGGFGAAPKFPQLHSLTYLLRHYHFTKHQASLQHASFSLQQMINGGIYDQLRGGLARYSTDAVWLVPHFEKMLYDNALFLQTLSEAYLLTNNSLFKTTIDDTINFLQTDLMAANHLFYAALDADSEGIEGKYYCYNLQEIEQLLTADEVAVAAPYYNITATGNWTEPHHNITTNILHLTTTLTAIATANNISLTIANNLLHTAQQKLLTARYKRVPPLTDDKCILGWNALLCKALVQCYTATNNPKYLQLAINNMDSMLSIFIVNADANIITNIYHTYKNEQATITAFLDDIAYLLEALLQLYNVTLSDTYKAEIYKIIQYLNLHYACSETPFYYYTKINQTHIILRKKEIYDGATPSGNAVLALVLVDAALLYNEEQWHLRAKMMLQSVANAVLQHTGSFGVWATLCQKLYYGVNEIKSDYKQWQTGNFNNFLIPYKLLHKTVEINDKYMLCKHQTCQLPVATCNIIAATIKSMEESM